MKLAMLLALALAACKASGGSAGGGGGIDAGTADGASGLVLHGRVCLLRDPADMGNSSACVPAAAGGLTVTLGTGASTTPGTRTTTTAADGSFTISAPMGAGFTWHVFGGSGANVILRSAMPFGTDNTIPVITESDYATLQGSNDVMVTDLQGSIFLRVVRGATPVAQVTASSSPDTLGLARYDPGRNPGGTINLVWNEDPVGTGARGVVWFAGVPLIGTVPTSTLVTLTQQGARLATPTAIVEDQTITFVTVELP
ncbi:MAG TPA: hypothetical protein VFT22_12695 [Kofleriaceae bacterium]|nr:hypothetical protein [Kofleriaceae bacterium]